MHQKGFTSVTIGSCSNCWGTLILAQNCNWLQFYSALVYLVFYQIFKVCIALMYMQHKQMLYGELHIRHYLVLDKNANVNAYSTPLRHEVWNVDHKKLMLGIDLCHNIFSQICVQHQHYPEHDTVCLSVFFPWTFFCICPDHWHQFCEMLFCQMLLGLLS